MQESVQAVPLRPLNSCSAEDRDVFAARLRWNRKKLRRVLVPVVVLHADGEHVEHGGLYLNFKVERSPWL